MNIFETFECKKFSLLRALSNLIWAHEITQEDFFQSLYHSLKYFGHLYL